MAGDAFFSKTRKRKRPNGRPISGLPAKKRSKSTNSRDSINPKNRRRKDDELDSAGSDDDVGGDIDDLDLKGSDMDEKASDDELQNETPAEKRLRLAKLYLDSVREDLGDGEVDAAEIDRELIASRLKQDVLQQSGKINLFLADTLPLGDSPPILRTRGHRFAVTSATASQDAKFMYTAGKEGTIQKWNLENGKKLATFPRIRLPSSSASKKGKGKAKVIPTGANGDVHGHTDEVLALAISGDGKYLASGGRDRILGVWDTENDKWVRGFSGHRDIISSIVFRKGTQQLYTASFDRTIKLFDLAIMGYVETLFGHQDSVTSIDALRGEFALTSGGQDRTVRFWKIVDETQLVFRGGGRSKIREVLEGGLDGDAPDEAPMRHNSTAQKQSGFVEGRIDCVAMLDETTFVSGGDSGSVSLWSTTKKKPLFSLPEAHGVDVHVSEAEGAEGSVRNPRWITCIASLPYSDLFASGSWDGSIRLWKVDPSLRSFSALRTLEALGFVNSLQLIRPLHGSLPNATWLAGTATETNGDTSRVKSSRQGQARAKDIFLIAGVGREPRLGRWMNLKGDDNNQVRNGALVFALTRSILDATFDRAENADGGSP